MVFASRGPEGKLAAPAVPIADLIPLADYIFVEADGSRRLPLKAHAGHEPVIPPGTSGVIQVVGGSGIGRRVCETVHRPEIFLQILAKEGIPGHMEDPVTPEMIGTVICHENLADLIFLNQADLLDDPQGTAERIAEAGCRRTVYGSLFLP